MGKRRTSVVHSRASGLGGSWALDGLLFFLPSKKNLNMNFLVQTLSSVRENNIVVFEKDESTVLLLLVPLFKIV